MVFSSVTFLFLFLPIVLGVYYLLSHRFRNVMLLIASLLFYAWGGPGYTFIMLFSIALNWLVGLAIELMKSKKLQFLVLSLGVTLDIMILCYYKYAGFITENLNVLLTYLGVRKLDVVVPLLPIGISFFTFHAISYIVDIYRKEAAALKNPFDIGLYISLFPQLVAGPIIRFHDIAGQIIRRTNTIERFASGCERFIYGLGKKVLIANPLGQAADHVFGLQFDQLSAGLAWFGLICYTLQIYFDFSGYSDMAIGLGRMLGFEFPENFNYPYIASSIRGFWRRWHLSLSTWFRDYFYVPLGGNRVPSWRVYLNLFLVFFLCGLWHGATWNFAIWGCLHGLFLILERGRLGLIINAAPVWIAHAYTLLVVMVGWVFFRAETLGQAMGYLAAIAGFGQGDGYGDAVALYFNATTIVPLILGIVLATPAFTCFARDWNERRYPSEILDKTGIDRMVLMSPEGNPGWLRQVRLATCLIILMISAAYVSAETYNPFIYFRF